MAVSVQLASVRPDPEPPDSEGSDRVLANFSKGWAEGWYAPDAVPVGVRTHGGGETISKSTPSRRTTCPTG